MAEDLSDIDAAFGGGTGGGAPPLTVTPAASSGGMADIDAAFAKGTAQNVGPSVAKDMAAQIPAGLVAGTTALAGTPGDLQTMNSSIWGRLSSHAVHGLLYMAGQIKTPEDEANFKKMMGALSSDGSGLADQAIRQGTAQTGLPDAVGTALSASSLPTSQQTLDTAKAVPGVSYITPDPQTGPGRYTRAAVSMFPAMFAGGEPLLADGALQAGKRVVTEAVAPGVGAEAAQSATDDPTLKPLAGFVGGMAGGMAPHAAAKTVGAIAETAPVAGALDKVGISGPAQTRAAKQFVDTATDPAAVRGALANPANPTGDAGTQFASISAPNAEGVPTFAQPTTPELTQDPGLLIAQRRDMAKNPDAYLPQIAANNDTRLRAMQSDVGANPMDVANHVQDHIAFIHDDAQAKVDQAKDAAAASLQQAQEAGQQHVAGAADATQATIAQAQDAAAAGSAQAQDAAQSRIASTDQTTQAAIDDARSRQSAATAPIQGAAPEALGEGLRSPIEGINAEAKAREGALHQAIDPNGTLVASSTPISDAVDKVYGGLSDTAKAFVSPAERTFTDLIDNYGPNIPYREGADLSSNLSAAMRTERMQNGQTPAYRRMTQLMSGVKTALNDTVRQRVEQDGAAVASGQMAPEDTIEAHVQALTQKWAADFGGNQAYAGNELARTGTGPFRVSSGRASGIAGSGRTTGAPSGEPVRPPSNPGIPEEALGEPDPEVAGRIAAANAATRERKQTYEKGAIGEMLRPDQVAGEFRISDSQVPAKVFRPGPKGGDAAREYLRAANGDQNAVSALHATATNELAKIVEKNDGVLTAGGLAHYKRRFGDSLRAIDEHTPGFSGRFDDIPQATEAVERAVGDRKEAMRAAQQESAQSVRAADQAGRQGVRSAEMDGRNTMRSAQQHADQLARDADRTGRQGVKDADAAGRQASRDYQQGIVKNLITSQNPEAVVAHFKSMLFDAKGGVAEANRISEALKGNPEAEAGMRNAAARAFSEHVTGSQKLVGGEKGLIRASSGDLYQKALPVLSRLFPQEHVAHITKVLADAERAEKAFTGSKLPGGSNTAQDAAGGHGGAHGLTLGQLAVYEYLAEHAGGLIKKVPFGAQALAVGGFALRTMRNMGINSTQKYFNEMIRNPEFAAQMVKRVSPTYDARQGRITGLVRKALIRGNRPDDDEPPAGGAPNQPPPTGPFSRGTGTPSEAGNRGAGAPPERGETPISDAKSGANVGLVPLPGGRVEPSAPNVPLTRRQARILLGDGHEPEAIGKMTTQERAAAVQGALDRGASPAARLNPADMAKMGGALPHAVHDGRTGDGRFSQSGDILEHADARGRIEPTWHPDADATQQAILAHEQRLHGMASQLGPNASVKDISDAAQRASDDVLAMVRAYHASPRLFDRFDLSHVGAGEGTQNEGHGLYVGGDPRIMEHYASTLGGARGEAMHRYEVAIDRDDGHFLQHEKPLAEQSGYVRNILSKHDIEGNAQEIANFNGDGSVTGDHLYRALVNKLLPDAYASAGGDLPTAMRAVTEQLSREGLAGVRYRSPELRQEDVYNHVVFNDHDIKITHRNGEAVPDEARQSVLANMRRTTDPGEKVLHNPETGVETTAKESGSLSDMLRQHASDPQFAGISDRIQKLVGDTPVHVVDKNAMHTLTNLRVKIAKGQELAGAYDPKAGHILLSDKTFADPKQRGEVLMHEAVHAALMHVINGSENARALIDHLRTTALAQHVERGGVPDQHYGLSNAHEFMSEALSNPEFQRFLGSIPADDRMVRAYGLQSTPRTMWDAVVGAMRKILGLAPDQHTHLDAAMKLGGHLLDMADAQQARPQPGHGASP